MVDKILFLPWIMCEQLNVEKVTCKSGWSTVPGGYSLLTKAFSTRRSVAVDKTAWDWTMPAWCMQAYVMAKRDQAIGWDPLYEHMIGLRIQQVMGPLMVVRLPCGTRLTQDFVGVMKSGWLLTLSANSASQFFQHAVTWHRMIKDDWMTRGFDNPLPYMWAMGDDLIMQWPDDVVETALTWKHTNGDPELHGEAEFNEIYQITGRLNVPYESCSCDPDIDFDFETTPPYVDDNWRSRCNAVAVNDNKTATELRGHPFCYTYELLEQYGKVMATTGCIVKHVKPSREFAGFYYPDGGMPHPLYEEKHKFILRHVAPEKEQDLLKAYFLLYALVPRFGWLRQFRGRAEFPVGTHIVAWAHGVRKLKFLTPPDVFNF